MTLRACTVGQENILVILELSRCKLQIYGVALNALVSVEEFY